MGRIFAVMLAAGLLGACAVGGSGRAPGQGPSQGLAPGGAGPATPESTLAARHCYRTLARVDCHAQPLAAEASRRVGFFDRPAGS
jgi:hypothetical protein